MTSQKDLYSENRILIEHLLKQVAKLCALATIPHEDAVASLSAAYKATTYLSERVGNMPSAFETSQILSEWHQNPEFLDDDAQPKKLSNEDFARLCRSTAPELRPDAVLQMLLNAGAASRTEAHIEVTSRSLLLKKPNQEGLERAIELVTAYIGTLSKNLEGPPDATKLFERTVVNTQLSTKQIPALLAYLNLHGQSFLEDLDAWMSRREDTKHAKTIGVGMYLFTKD